MQNSPRKQQQEKFIMNSTPNNSHEEAHSTDVQSRSQKIWSDESLIAISKEETDIGEKVIKFLPLRNSRTR
jgi:hypothetical protein